jgi:hypothetical protein
MLPTPRAISLQMAPMPRPRPRSARLGTDGPDRGAGAGRRTAVVRVPAFARLPVRDAPEELDPDARVLVGAVPDEAFALPVEVLATGTFVVRAVAARVRGFGVAAASPAPERGRDEAEVFPAMEVTVVAAVT